MHYNYTLIVRKHNFLLFLKRKSSKPKTKARTPGQLIAWVLKVIIPYLSTIGTGLTDAMIWCDILKFNSLDRIPYSLLFTCFLNQLTAWLAAVNYFVRKNLASCLPTGAGHHYSQPICCLRSWLSRAITVYHIRTATMQLRQFRPEVSQFNETNKVLQKKKVFWHHMKQNWLTDWTSQFSADLHSILSISTCSHFVWGTACFQLHYLTRANEHFFKICYNYQGANVSFSFWLTTTLGAAKMNCRH